MLIPKNRYWAKLRRTASGEIDAWLSNTEHCVDVAATLATLTSIPGIAARLARTAGLETLSPSVREKLNVLAGIHDIGKYNHGFNNRRHLHPRFWAGHEREAYALLNSGDEYQSRFVELFLGAGFDDWDQDSLPEYLAATLIHHGRPRDLKASRLDHSMARLWGATADRDPLGAVESHVEIVRNLFPAAFEDGADELPTSRPFQHAYNGLLTLADWIGSDERFFPLTSATGERSYEESLHRARRAVRTIGLDPTEPRKLIQGAKLGYREIWGFDTPRPAQKTVADLPLPQNGSLTILEGPTGSGKTETAVLRYLLLFMAGLVDGLYFALPTRAAAKQIHQRITDAVETLFGNSLSRPPVILGVPGYIRVDQEDGTRLPPTDVLWPDATEQQGRGWAAEHSKRYLAGPIVVGTIDQVLLSGLQTKHSHLRASSLMRHLLVVDEVHASDVYMNSILEGVLSRHLDAGGHAFLMSATLGSRSRDRFLSIASEGSRAAMDLTSAVETPYPAVWNAVADQPTELIAAETSQGGKTVKVDAEPIAGDPEAIARRALDAALDGARTLVVRNTVQGALAVQQALERLAAAHPKGHEFLFKCQGVVTPHHSRYAAEDRAKLDLAVEATFGKGTPSRGVVLVATQTVEQSLDIDADLLLTDLCPMDVLLQRIGRLHRHDRSDRPLGYTDPRVEVLVPERRDLTPYIRTRARGSISRGQATGPNGLGTVYDDLRILEATWRIVEAGGAWSLPKENRRLVESSTHPEVLAPLAEEGGDVWAVHGTYIAEQRTADGVKAGFSLVNTSFPWTDPRSLFPPPGDGSPQSRLGERDRLVEFPEPIESPFGSTIGAISVPHYWARRANEDASVTVTEAFGGQIDFIYGDVGLQYRRQGLHCVSN